MDMKRPSKETKGSIKTWRTCREYGKNARGNINWNNKEEHAPSNTHSQEAALTL
jgi:hypothetical protein